MNKVNTAAFTEGLEDALRFAARQPTLPLAYVARRFDVQQGDLAAWLGAHNGGERRLTEKRVLEVLEKAKQGTLVGQNPTRAEVRGSGAPAKHHHTGAPHLAANEAPPLQKSAAAPASTATTALEVPTSDIGRWLEKQRVEIVGRVNCFQVTVTPALATAWLALNSGNRKPSRAKIKRFAAAMKAQRWHVNGETVKFSITGRLIDGQSRLMAIEQAGVPVVLEIRAGLPDVAQESMDSGELRKGAHMLEMKGEANPAQLAAALKLVWLWRKGWLAGHPWGVSLTMENGEVGALLASCPELKASVGWVFGPGAKIERLLTKSEAAFFHWLLGTADVEQRDAFFEALVDGVGLTKQSPVYHLREKLLAERGGADSQARKIERRALVFKAWNAVYAGEKLAALTWKAGEEFPGVMGLKPIAAAKDSAANGGAS